MTNIERFIARKAASDTAVYWGTPTNNEEGYLTYADPVEIDCWWKDVQELMRSAEGKEIASRAVVYVTQDIDEQGMLYHGNLTDLTAAQQADPRKVTNAYEVKRFIKTPSLRTTDKYVRKCYLGYGTT